MNVNTGDIKHFSSADEADAAGYTLELTEQMRLILEPIVAEDRVTLADGLNRAQRRAKAREAKRTRARQAGGAR